MLPAIRAGGRARRYMVGVRNVIWILCTVALLCFLWLREEDKLLDPEAAAKVPASQPAAWTSPSCHLSGACGRVGSDSGMLFLHVNRLIRSQMSGHGVTSQVIPTLDESVPTTTRHHLIVYFLTFLLGSVAQASLFGKRFCLYFFVYW